MDESARSFFIKKVDLMSKNKENTQITPFVKESNKCKMRKPLNQAYVGVHQRKFYQKDRQIEPVRLPPRRTSTYEELLRRAKIRKFESRDRRIQDFQLKKKLQQEKKRHENERKRQQFLLNRERIEREKAAKLLEMEQRRRENRKFYQSFVESSRMYRDRKNYYDGNFSSEERGHSVDYKGKAERKNAIFTESTMSLYGVERNKYGELCASQLDDLESQKFRIYLPPKKFQKPGKPAPRPQPYRSPKCLQDMLTPAHQKANPRNFLKDPRMTLSRQSSEVLVKPSYNGPTAVSILNRAEEDPRSKRPKKIVYKLSKSNFYAPSKLLLRHKKSKLYSRKKFVAVCECGGGLTESEAKLVNKCSSESASFNHEFHRNPVQADTKTTPEKVGNKYRDSKIPVKISPYKTQNCKSNKNENGNASCFSSLKSSTVAAHESNTSTKYMPSSRKTGTETACPVETTENGSDVYSVTTKILQSTSIARTLTPSQCKNTCQINELGSGEENFSETFMCEETSLTGLINASSDSPEVEINTADDVVGVREPQTNQEVTSPHKRITKPDASKVGINREEDVPLIAGMLKSFNHCTCCNATTGYSIHDSNLAWQSHAEQVSRSPSLLFQTSMEARDFQPQISCMVGRTQYVILPGNSQEPECIVQLECAVPFYNFLSRSSNGMGHHAAQTELEPEFILTSNNEEYDEMIIVTAASEAMNHETSMTMFDFDETSGQSGFYPSRQNERQLYSHSNSKIIEIQNNDRFEDSAQTEAETSKDLNCRKPRYEFRMDRSEVSKDCLHIRQIELTPKQVHFHKDVRSPYSGGSNAKQKASKANARLENHRGNDENMPNNTNCHRCRKCYCEKRKKSNDEKEKGKNSTQTPCNSMEIMNDAFLLDKMARRQCKKCKVRTKTKDNTTENSSSESSGKTYFSKNMKSRLKIPIAKTISPDPEEMLTNTFSNLRQLNNKNDKLESQGLELVNHVPLRTGLSHSKLNSSSDRSNKSLEDDINVLNPSQLVNDKFFTALAKETSKQSVARIPCSCRCLKTKNITEQAVFAEKNRAENAFNRKSQKPFEEHLQQDGRSFQETNKVCLKNPLKAQMHSAGTKCDENYASYNSHRKRLRVLNHFDRSQLKTPAYQNVQSFKTPRKSEQECPEKDCKSPNRNSPEYQVHKLDSNLAPTAKSCKCHNLTPNSAHDIQLKPQNVIALGSAGSVKQMVPLALASSLSPTSRSVPRKKCTGHKKNREKLPHRRGGDRRIPKKLNKPLKKKTRSIATKQISVKEKDSSTVDGLYEPNDYSVVSLYRKSSKTTAVWRANLLEIKKRYSHIITSCSSNLNRRTGNTLSPYSTNLRAFPIPGERNENHTRHRKRTLSTISIYGSEELYSTIEKFDNHFVRHESNSEVFCHVAGCHDKFEKAGSDREQVDSHQL